MEPMTSNTKPIPGAEGSGPAPVIDEKCTACGAAMVVKRGRFGESFARAFVPLNLAEFPESLIESELFGHERGAFTGAQARRDGVFAVCSPHGSIFLDEIGELSAPVQIKLLRVLQERVFTPVGGEGDREADVRVIAATNRDLADLVATGTFRRDLFFRLSVLSIRVPPLRDRLDDLEELVPFLLARSARKLGLSELPVVSEDAWEGMRRHTWPGNVRELENFIKRMIVLQDLSLPRTLVVTPAVTPAPAEEAFSATKGLSLKEISRRAVLEAEREVICRALEQCRWNRVKTAKMLKISYRALLYKIKDMGLRQDPAAS